MADFSIIIHPVNLELIYFFDPGARKKRVPLLKKILEWMPSFYTCKIERVMSKTGKCISGHFIMCPLLPEQILNGKPELVIKRVIDACRIAENLNSKIIGLAAYVSLVGKRGLLIAKHLKPPVTTGTCYTIAIGLEALIKAVEKVGLSISGSRAVVIGATGTIGSISAHFLADKVANLTLVARNKQRLSDLSYGISEENKLVNINTSDNINEAIKGADIIYSSTNTPAALIDVISLKPGAIVCDMSQPRNINISETAIKEREDILVIDGGVVQTPDEVNFNFNFGLSPGFVFACMAETMILALEEKYESYSLGGNTTLAKIKEISQLALKHGFKLAELRSFNRKIKESKFRKIRNIIKSRKKVI